MTVYNQWLQEILSFDRVPNFDEQWHDMLDVFISNNHPYWRPPHRLADDNCLARDIIGLSWKPRSAGVIAFVDCVTDNGVFGWCKKRNSDSTYPAVVTINGTETSNAEFGLYRKDVHDAGIGNGKYGFRAEFSIGDISKPYVLCTICDEYANLAAYRFFNLTKTPGPDSLSEIVMNMINAGNKKWAFMLLQDAEGLIACDISTTVKFAACAFDFGNKRLTDRYLEQWSNGACEHTLSAFLSHINSDQVCVTGKSSHFMDIVFKFSLSPVTSQEIDFINGVFQDVMIERPHKAVKYLYDNFVRNYMLPANADCKNGINFITDKIAFVVGNMQILSYWLPVIKLEPFSIFDVICVYECDDHQALMSGYDLDTSHVFLGLDSIHNYKLCIVDDHLYMNDKAVNEALLDINKILLTHTVMGLFYGLDTARLGIYPSENLCSWQRSIILRDIHIATQKNIHEVYSGNKCEIAFTGPYHIGDNLRVNFNDKTSYRRLLERELGCDIPTDRPVVFCVEEQHFCLNQIVRALNMLADDCTIIFRPYYRTDWHQIKKLRNDIIIYTKMRIDGEAGFHKSPNTARFAADFIMCGMFNGTFYSGLMLGLNVIPYFTKIIKHKTYDIKPYPCSELLEKHRSGLIFHPFSKYIYNHWPFFFDVVNVEKIREAILGREYVEWLQQNMPEIQKRVFGKYHIKDADMKTFEYILKFAGNGTLGDDAAAVYLKETFYATGCAQHNPCIHGSSHNVVANAP